MIRSSARKLLHYGRIYAAWQVRGQERLPYLPEDLSLELTNTCNFSCSYCLQSDPAHFERVARTKLSPDDAEVLLRRLREGGVTTDVIHWTLDGEPFVHKEIDAITERAIRHGFRTFIFATNGFFCSPERLRALPTEAPSGKVRYSLHIDFCADAEMFEENRGTKGSWSRIHRYLSAVLSDPGLDHIDVHLTDISSFPLEDEGEIAEHFQALQQLFPPSQRLRVTSRIFHNATGFVGGVLARKRERKGSYNLCPYPWSSLVVASNGDVVACCRDLQHKTVLGNLLQQELPEIWNGEAYRTLRRNLASGNPEASAACQGCDLPWDDGKFTWRHLARTAVHRLGVFG